MGMIDPFAEVPSPEARLYEVRKQLATAERERDEARAAAGWLFQYLVQPVSFDARGQALRDWPWLQQKVAGGGVLATEGPLTIRPADLRNGVQINVAEAGESLPPVTITFVGGRLQIEQLNLIGDASPYLALGDIPTQFTAAGHAQDLFRELRRQWFVAHIKSHPHEREWEDAEHECRREVSNAELLKKFDEDTERLLRGERACVAPLCGADLDAGRAE